MDREALAAAKAGSRHLFKNPHAGRMLRIARRDGCLLRPVLTTDEAAPPHNGCTPDYVEIDGIVHRTGTAFQPNHSGSGRSRATPSDPDEAEAALAPWARSGREISELRARRHARLRAYPDQSPVIDSPPRRRVPAFAHGCPVSVVLRGKNLPGSVAYCPSPSPLRGVPPSPARGRGLG